MDSAFSFLKSEHGHHDMPMPGHDMPMDMSRCSMNMLWNSQVKDVCVVFERWHISGWFTMLVSCLAVMIVSIGYASLLHRIRQYDLSLAISYSSDPSKRDPYISPRGYQAVDGSLSGRRSPSPVLGSGKDMASPYRLPLHIRIIRASMYSLSVGISFWLMLVAMTYNTYLFVSIVLGAFLGHVIYEGEMDISSILHGASSKGLACH